MVLRLLHRANAACLVWAGWSAPVLAQTFGGGSEVGPPAWRVILALLICCGLAVAAAHLLRARLGQQASGAPWMRLAAGLQTFIPQASARSTKIRRLRLIETVRLNPQTDVCLLRCDGAELLVAAGPQGVVLLREAAAETEGGPE